MKRLMAWTLALLALVVLGPMLLRQLQAPEDRSFTGDTLDPARYVEVRFRNEAQGFGLAGLLFLPGGEGPFPAAVIIHGSGTSRRANRWYLSLAHHLQDRGIAVLLPDKRGSEQSGGAWRSASYADLATDTLAAVDYLMSREDLPLSAIGVIGMSQGGSIAPLVAARTDRLDWLVSVVGCSVTAHQQFLYEEGHNLRQLGVLPGIAEALARLTTWVHRRFVQRDFWDAVGDFDPLPWWRELQAPALALFGAADTNTPTLQSAALLEGLGKSNIGIVVFEGSGHALEDPPGSGDRLFREDALDTISGFIQANGNARPHGPP